MTPDGSTIAGNWQRLLDTVNLVFEGTPYLQPYVYLMEHIGPDKVIARPTPNGAGHSPSAVTTFLGMRRAPAAKEYHHAFEGGLVFHYQEMWNIWKQLFWIPKDDVVNDQRVLAAIFNHDIHKAYRTFVQLETKAEWAAEYGKDATDQLLDNTVKSIWILKEHNVPLDPIQLNALCWAEGGFAERKPRWSTVLAKVAYLLDELSGNVMSRVREGQILDVRTREAWLP